MSSVAIALIVTVLLLTDAVVVGAVLHYGGSLFGTLAKAHPAREPAPDAVRRNFQTIRIGMFSFGGCVHIAVDDFGLHLLPARLLRLVKTQPVSIPWSAISSARAGRRHTTIRVGGEELSGPNWAFALAAGGADTPGPRP